MRAQWAESRRRGRGASQLGSEPPHCSTTQSQPHRVTDTKTRNVHQRFALSHHHIKTRILFGCHVLTQLFYYKRQSSLIWNRSKLYFLRGYCFGVPSLFLAVSFSATAIFGSRFLTRKKVNNKVRPFLLRAGNVSSTVYRRDLTFRLLCAPNLTWSPTKTIDTTNLKRRVAILSFHSQNGVRPCSVLTISHQAR